MFSAINELLTRCRTAVTNTVYAHQSVHSYFPALKSPLGTSSCPATKPEGQSLMQSRGAQQGV